MRWLPLSLVVFLSIASALISVRAMRWGPWGYSDSVSYIASARSLAQGRGLTLPGSDDMPKPALLHPPLYSMLIAPAYLLGIDGLDWTRGLQALLSLLFPLVIAGMLLRAGINPWVLPAVVLGMLVFPPHLANIASAMSEMLCLTLGFSGMLLLLPYLSVLRARRLVVAGILCGLAALTRYTGLAFAVAGLALVLMSPLRRLRRTALFLLPALLPLTLWFVISGSAGARGLAADTTRDVETLFFFLRQTADLLAAWLPYGTRGLGWLPPSTRLWLIVLVVTAFSALMLPDIPSGPRRLFGAAAVYAAAHMAIVAATFTLADIQPDLIPRIFSPLWPAFWLILAALVHSGRRMDQETEKPWRRAAGPLLLTLLAAVSAFYYSPQLTENVHRGWEEGVGYTASIWRASPAFDWIQANLQGRNLISDEPAMITLYTGRGAKDWAPWIHDNLLAARDGTVPQGLQAEMDDGAALVLFLPRLTARYGAESLPLPEGWVKRWCPLLSRPEVQVWEACR